MANFKEIALAVREIITEAKDDLGFVDVFYGEQNLIPRTPSVLVVSPQFTREPYETRFGARTTVNISLIVAYSAIKSSQIAFEEMDELIQSFDAYMHKDRTIRGLAVDAYINSMTRGDLQLTQASLYKAASLNLQVTTQEQLG